MSAKIACMKIASVILLTFASLTWVGCGAAPNQACVTSFSLQAGPVNANGSSALTGQADHNAAAPGNQQQFAAHSGEVVISGACAETALIASVRPQWTTSDAIDVTISSANDLTNGLAVCTGTTLTPATITATYTSGATTKTATSSLTCQ